MPLLQNCNKEKRKKRSLLEKIMLQKEIEGEIENEIKEQEEKLFKQKKENDPA